MADKKEIENKKSCEKIKTIIKNNPEKSTLIGFGIGLLTGSLLVLTLTKLKK